MEDYGGTNKGMQNTNDDKVICSADALVAGMEMKRHQECGFSFYERLQRCEDPKLMFECLK